MSNEIVYVLISLDDGMPDDMMGLIRCGSVISEDEDGAEKSHDDLIDNKEFHSAQEMIEYVAGKLKVSPDIVEVDAD